PPGVKVVDLVLGDPPDGAVPDAGGLEAVPDGALHARLTSAERSRVAAQLPPEHDELQLKDVGVPERQWWHGRAADPLDQQGMGEALLLDRELPERVHRRRPDPAGYRRGVPHAIPVRLCD